MGSPWVVGANVTKKLRQKPLKRQLGPNMQTGSASGT
jgi:hypothetical protein